MNCDFSLKPGQYLTYSRPPWIEPHIPSRTIVVLHIDPHVLAINKVSGVPVLPGGYFHENTILHLLKEKFGKEDIDRSTPVHRLGRGTSGVLLIARNKNSSQSLCRDFREHKMKKTYIAILSGIIQEDEFDVHQPIGKQTTSSMKLSSHHWVALDSGKTSHSHFKVLFRDPNQSITLCQVTITTGRPHQIRIHSAYAGHPLFRDPLYVRGGGVCDEAQASEDEEAFNEELKPKAPVPGDCGYFLHCWRMQFEHPTSKQTLAISCTPPPEMCSFFPGYDFGEDTK